MDPSERPADQQRSASSEGVFAPVSISKERPRVGWWLTLLAIGLVAVIVKPWGGDGRGGTAADTEPAIEPIASPAAAERPASITNALVGTEARDFCLDPTMWLAATTERWRGRSIRIWRAMLPAKAATGPDDPSIPAFEVVSEGVTELGWCAPVAGEERPVGKADVDVWKLTDGHAVLVRPVRVLPAGAPSPLGALYVPWTTDRSDGSEQATWPEGRFVFRYRTDADGDRWFAILVVDRPVVRSQR